MYLQPLLPIADLQSDTDHRNLTIQRAGIKDYRHPLLIQDKSPTPQPSIGTFSMMVEVPAHLKGTHMSRFIEILQEGPVLLSMANIPQWLSKINDRLHASQACLEVAFPFFMTKKAPISGTPSLMHYDVVLSCDAQINQTLTQIKVVIPVTSLCPCSKAIAEYGAHNQRSHITVTATIEGSLYFEDLIPAIESQASCELYAILKRPDEKKVTERAYENPKFVEDLVRDVANALAQFPAIRHYVVESVNFESIHNHSAYAMIQGSPPIAEL